MKIIKFFSRILLSSWFLALIPAILLISFLPAVSSKYKLEVLEGMNYKGQKQYVDLNGDSISECVMVTNQKPYNSVVVFNNERQIYDQWNIPDTLVENISDLHFGDFNHNGIKEIYLFSLKSDSLFLNANEFFLPNGFRLNRKFITKIELAQGMSVSNCSVAGFYDRNKDGNDEIYFGISSGYGKEPRRVYCFDLVNKELHASSFTGSIPFQFYMEDLDGDQVPELFGNMTAPGNYKTKAPFSDSSTWLMVFDANLKFKFSPVQFPGFTNMLSVNPLQTGLNKSLLVMHVTANADSSIMTPRILLFSSKGKLIKSKILDDLNPGNLGGIFVLHSKSREKIVLVEKCIYVFNDSLEILKKIESPFHSLFQAYAADINFDRQEELLLYSAGESKIQVYDSELKLKAEREYKTPDLSWSFSRFEDKNHVQMLFIKSESSGNYIKLSNNPYFFLGYIACAGIYSGFFLFILLIRKITTYQLSQRENLKRRLLNLQLQSIKSQLDPHFTFNALNSIAALIYEDDRQSAYDHMNKFTQLLRRMLNDADSIYRTLQDEIQFVKTYMDLEKLRFGEKFTYEIHIEEGIDTGIMVPKMVFQTFTENAIKHGIMARTEGGKIVLKAERDKDYLKLSIEDNGIGRVNSAGKSKSTGKGLLITDEFYQILNQLNKQAILYNITDLYDDLAQPRGTRVEILVPVAS